jgi:hypothetical protein
MAFFIFAVYRMYTYVRFKLSVKTVKKIIDIADIITPGV